MKRKWIIVVTATVILAWTMPYLVAWLFGGTEWEFKGFLLNPIDGFSYIAKMRFGWMGEWRFQLPYTAEPGSGAYLFLFYIALGHLARILNTPLVLLFHLVRLVSGMFMLWGLWKFIVLYEGDERKGVPQYFGLVVFGSGMGWLLSPILGVTSDLWVAEAYPFLSGYSNPHFPLGIGLMLWIMNHYLQPISSRTRIFMVIEGLLLSIIMPFGLVVVGVVLSVYSVWKWFLHREFELEKLLWIGTAGGSFLLYQYIATLSDPQLSQWNLQNNTPAPPLWDMVASFSPMIILVLIGFAKTWRQEKRPLTMLVVSWFICGLVLIAIPFALQRRFMVGFLIPTALLAMSYLSSIKPRRKSRILYTLIVASSILTNALVLLFGGFGIGTKNPSFYVSKNEAQALEWFAENVSSRSLVLASPQMGTVIPAVTGNRVLYGHPFETINAAREKELVERLLNPLVDPAESIKEMRERQIGYVFFDLRESESKLPAYLLKLDLIFENPDVKVFRIAP